jgi:hypothetical protein
MAEYFSFSLQQTPVRQLISPFSKLLFVSLFVAIGEPENNANIATFHQLLSLRREKHRARCAARWGSDIDELG